MLNIFGVFWQKLNGIFEVKFLASNGDPSEQSFYDTNTQFYKFETQF